MATDKICNPDSYTALAKEDKLYVYPCSNQIALKSGFIGHLRAYFNKGFHSSWLNFNDRLRTDVFRNELDGIVSFLKKNILSSFTSLCLYCKEESDRSDAIGIRIDSNGYTFLIRLNPFIGDYNAYIYCYCKDLLDYHMNQSSKGIRFIDSRYRTKFRLDDGGNIVLTTNDGNCYTYNCRYIDDYHFELEGETYHVCEFAEKVEAGGYFVAPIRRPL